MQMDEANTLIEKFEYHLVNLLSKRTLLESFVFPVHTYIAVGLYNLYYKAPKAFQMLAAHITPEELGRRGRVLCSTINQKTHFSIMLGYLVGREQLIMDGAISTKEEIAEDEEKLLNLLSFWKKMVMAYRNNEGIFVSDTGNRLNVLDEHDLMTIRELIQYVDDVSRDKLRRMMALIQSYLFLLNCESRGNIFHHGPYMMEGKNSVIVVREFSSLKSGPLAVYVDANPPWPNLAVALELKGVQVKIDEVGTMHTQPEDYTPAIEGFALLYNKQGKLTELGREAMDEITSFVEQAQNQVFSRVTELDEHSLIISGALQYSNLTHYFDVAGVSGYTNELHERCIDEHLARMINIRIHPFMRKLNFLNNTKRLLTRLGGAIMNADTA